MTLHRQDRAFAQRLLRGDEDAFEFFFEQNYSVIYRFALRRMSGDEQGAEEVAQATLCIAFRRISTYRGEAGLLTWVLTICRRQIATWYRDRGRHAAEIAVEDLDLKLAASLETLTDTADNPERRAQRAQIRERIASALDRLPATQRRALQWKYLEGHSVREISVRLEVTEKAAESVLSRARAGFREAFVLLDQAQTLGTSQSRTQGASS